jgi:hypothetical protein
MSTDLLTHAFAPEGGPLCGDTAAVHMSTGPTNCPGCAAAAATAAAGELSVIVVIDVSDDDRTPGQVALDVAKAAERGGEHLIYWEDLPPGVRILAPGERNGRA